MQLDRNGNPKISFESGANRIPSFPTGKASFQILSGQPDAEAFAVIQQLHDLIDQNHDRLQAVANSRKQARLLEEAQLKAHPRKPKDIILSTWRVTAKTATAQGKGAIAR